MNSPFQLSQLNSPKDSKRISFIDSNSNTNIAIPSERKQQIQVFVRLRPFIAAEYQENTVEIDSDTESIFDQAFDQSVSQKQVFDEFIPYLNDLLDGYNLTIFAYGQTGSGKTYTMFGADWEHMYAAPPPQQNSSQLLTSLLSPKTNLHQTTFFESIESDNNFAGIIPRTIYEVFRQINTKREHNPNMQISVYVSFIQIYNEKIFDLLQDNAKPVPLSIHENKDHGTYVEGLAEYQVAHYYDSLQLMKRGEKNRAIRTTSMNAKSSRSHTIFQMQIESIDDGEYAKEKKTIKRSKINLCDLAGSEKINKNEIMGGAHFNELRSINLSLTTLGKVIHSLSSNQKLPVPYRESKLTRILQDSLQGNCQTFIVANISPCQSSIDETFSTLKFAERAQHITLKVKPNEINASDIQVIQKLQREINYLKELLNMKKKGINTFDVHSRLLKLQEENERLKKTHISLNEVEKIIQENRQMKIEMSKRQTSTHSGGPGNGFFSHSRTDPQLALNGEDRVDSLKITTDPEIKLRYDLNIDHRSEFNSTHFNSRQQSHNDSIKISVGTPSDKPLNVYSGQLSGKSNIGNNSTFISTGRLMLKQSEPTTEMTMRIRGKHNDFKIEKGFLEISNAEQIRAEKRKKEKLKILERLGNLDRINQKNQDFLNSQLRTLDNSLEKKIKTSNNISKDMIDKPVIKESSSNRMVLLPLARSSTKGKSLANLQSILNHKTEQNSPKPLQKQLLPSTGSRMLMNSMSAKTLNTSENYELKIKRLEKKFLSKY